MRVGREIEDTYIDADRLRGEKDSAKVVVDHVDGGEARAG